MGLLISALLLVVATAVNGISAYRAKKEQKARAANKAKRALAVHAIVISFFWFLFMAYALHSYMLYLPDLSVALLAGATLFTAGSLLVRSGVSVLGYGAYINANLFLNTNAIKTQDNWAYKITDNPMYTGFTIQMVGISLVYTELDLLLLAGCLFVCLNLVLSRVESVD